MHNAVSFIMLTDHSSACWGFISSSTRSTAETLTTGSLGEAYPKEVTHCWRAPHSLDVWRGKASKYGNHKR